MPTPRQQIEAQVDWAIQNGKIPATDRAKHIEFLTSNADFYGSALAGGARFTQQAQEMAAQRRQLEEQAAIERRKLEAERAELSAWSRDARAEIENANRIRAEHEALIAENGRLRQIAEDYNFKPEDLPPSTRTSPTPRPAQPVYDPNSQRARDPQTGRFLSREEGTKFAEGVINMTSGAMKAAAEHFRLYGEPLADNIMEEALNAGETDVYRYYAGKYNIEAKRAELAEKAREAEIERIRVEERQKVMTEMALDPSRFVNGTPGYQPQTSPLADAYMHSRAAAQNPVSGQEGTAIVPPEKRSDLQMNMERVNRGAEAFAKHYNPDGTPRQGVKPHASYQPVSYEG